RVARRFLLCATCGTIVAERSPDSATGPVPGGAVSFQARWIMSVEAKPIRLSPVGKFIAMAIIVALAILLVTSIGTAATPFIIAAITAYLFNPIISWLHRYTGVGRALWIFVLYILVGTLIYLLARFLWPIIAMQYTELRRLI